MFLLFAILILLLGAELIILVVKIFNKDIIPDTSNFILDTHINLNYLKFCDTL